MMNMEMTPARAAGQRWLMSSEMPVRLVLVVCLLLPCSVAMADDSQAIQEAASDADGEPEQSAEEVEDEHLGQAAQEPAAVTSAALEAKKAAVAPTLNSLSTTGVVIDAPGGAASTGTVSTLRQALDVVSALQLRLVAEHQGDGAVPGAEELQQLRRSLELALVEVARLEQEQSLLQWLKGEGLRAALDDLEAARLAEQVASGEGADSAAVLMAGDGEQVVEEGRFMGVIRAIEDAPFKEGKLQVLTEQLRDARVDTEQVARLVELFAFSRDKVEALIFLHPRLLDPGRFEELLSSLKFASDRIAVRERLGLGGS
ncbi:MAG: hypothetical protein CMP23_04890 [Rickettsiales bacterium]|nr:hypothetical protein [Rickettsiales bacterium]|tara:strand:- start:1139 stop:2083 length:945 start_codon:yes stop_codon:yes gene_type:complete